MGGVKDRIISILRSNKTDDFYNPTFANMCGRRWKGEKKNKNGIKRQHRERQKKSFETNNN